MTKTFVIAENVTLETSDSVLIRVLDTIESVKAVIDAYKTMPYDKVLKATGYDWHKLSDLMESCYYEDAYKPYYDLVSYWYWEERNVSDEAYRNYAERDFLAYFKDGDPSDEVWEGACLSDWHKDIYGFRPHSKERIAVLVMMAQAMFNRG